MVKMLRLLIMSLLLTSLVAGCVTPAQDNARITSDSANLDHATISKVQVSDDDQPLWQRAGETLLYIASLGAYTYCSGDTSIAASKN